MLFTAAKRKVVSSCVVVSLFASLFVSGVNAESVPANAAPELPAYRVIEEFEGTGYLSAHNPIRAKSNFTYVRKPDPVMYDEQAGKLSYQFTNSETGTSAAYLNFWENESKVTSLPINGKPIKFGVWVYGDGNENLLRAHFNGTIHTVELVKDGELIPRGWRYMVFDAPDSKEPLLLNRIYVAQTNNSKKKDGEIYFDRLTAFYENTDGLYGLDLVGLAPMVVGGERTAQALETRQDYTAPQPPISEVTFTSSDSKVATIDAKGKVKALAAGTTTITASSGVFQSSYELVVRETEPILEELTIFGSEVLAIGEGNQTEVYASYEGEEAPLRLYDGVTYTSSNPNVLSVNESGFTKALQVGEATIEAEYEGLKAQIEVKVIDILQEVKLTNLSPVEIGNKVQAKLLAKYASLEEWVVSEEDVTYTSSNEAVASVNEQGEVTGKAVGAAIITAQLEDKSDTFVVVVNKPDLKAPKHELRAAWIATVLNIDWPTKTTLSMEQQKQEYIDILNLHQELGMNAVIMQIKPTADAFYKSEFAPWSEWLTGEQGKDPGYDPLQFMIDEAHKRNMEFHAWFNPYRISMHADKSKLVADHPAIQHPDWVITYGGRMYFDPGVPEVIEFITESVMEVVKNYDIDAVHFDDYFYPNATKENPLPDQKTYEKYGKDNGFSDINAWRRNNVDTLIKGLSEKIKEEKSYVKFGISPFGVWRNNDVDENGSDTKAGQPSYDNLHADIRKWVLEGWIDYVTPQIYWNFTFSPAAYEILVDWWSDLVRPEDVHTQLYIGHADYKVDENVNFTDPNEIPNQLKFNWNYEEVKGSMHFTTNDFQRKKELKQKVKDMYATPALVPVMPWLKQDAPEQIAASSLSAVQQGSGVKLSWKDTDEKTTYFVVYRSEGDKSINIDDPTQIAAIVRKQADQMTYVDQQTVTGKTYHYVITPVNRLHYEGVPSEELSITTKAAQGGGSGGIILPPSGSTTIAASGGGSVSVGEVTVTIPEGAMESSFQLFVTQLTNTAGINLGNHKVISSIYEITKSISGNFKKAVTISMSYDASKLGDMEKPALFYYDEEQEKWVYIGGVAKDGVITAQVDHFTKFAVLAIQEDQYVETCPATVFTDIEKHWAKAQIERAVKACIVNGFGDGTFRPEAALTREQFTVMLVRALGLSEEADFSSFSDQNMISKWAVSEVAIAVKAGLIDGYTDGTFRPQASINRAEITAMLVRALKLEQEAAQTGFTDDGDIPKWAKGYVAAAAKHQLVEGRSNGRFAPHENATRAESAVLMLRMLEHVK